MAGSRRRVARAVGRGLQAAAALALAVAVRGGVDAVPARQGPGRAASQEAAQPIEVPSCFATVIDEIGEPIGAVIAGRDPARLGFSAGDVVYLRVAEEVAPGEEHLLYRDEGETRGYGGRRLGHLIQLVGRVRVLERDGDRAIASIIGSCGEVEPGDLLHPILSRAPAADASVPSYDPARLVQGSAEDATVVFGSGESLPQRRGDEIRRGSLTPRRSYGVGDVVTIDRGAGQGWGQGTVVLFYTDDPRRSFGVAGDHDEPVVLGMGVVIWAAGDSAAVLVTTADRAIGLGDRAQRQR